MSNYTKWKRTYFKKIQRKHPEYFKAYYTKHQMPKQ